MVLGRAAGARWCRDRPSGGLDHPGAGDANRSRPTESGWARWQPVGGVLGPARITPTAASRLRLRVTRASGHALSRDLRAARQPRVARGVRGSALRACVGGSDHANRWRPSARSGSGRHDAARAARRAAGGRLRYLPRGPSTSGSTTGERGGAVDRLGPRPAPRPSRRCVIQFRPRSARRGAGPPPRARVFACVAHAPAGPGALCYFSFPGDLDRCVCRAARRPTTLRDASPRSDCATLP